MKRVRVWSQQKGAAMLQQSRVTAWVWAKLNSSPAATQPATTAVWQECQVCAGRGLVELLVPSVVPGYVQALGLHYCPACDGLGQVELHETQRGAWST